MIATNDQTVLAAASDASSPSAWLTGFLDKGRSWEDAFAGLMTKNPLEALGVMLLGGSAAFYAAEAGKNPKVKTFWDALYYVTTCASVGYADIFAATAAGKAVSSFVFTFGPALCARVFDRTMASARPARAGDAACLADGSGPLPRDGQAAQAALHLIADKLDAILGELQRLQRA